MKMEPIQTQKNVKKAQLRINLFIKMDSKFQKNTFWSPFFAIMILFFAIMIPFFAIARFSISESHG